MYASLVPQNVVVSGHFSVDEKQKKTEVNYTHRVFFIKIPDLTLRSNKGFLHNA